MKNLHISFVLSMLFLISACSTETVETTENTETGNKHQSSMDLATAWVTASLTSQEAAKSMVENNMAEDGVSVGERYVGFGFIWNPDGDGMVVDYVIPDSPADGVLKVGDDIVEVNGILLTNDNRNQLGFRGMPGESLDVVVVRDGSFESLSFARGPVQVRYSKEQVLNNITNGDAEGWGPEEFNIIETGATNDGVVHVLHWSEFVEEATGYKANAYTITRFMFDDDGKVAWVGNLSEDRFVLEQQGWNISR